MRTLLFCETARRANVAALRYPITAPGEQYVMTPLEQATQMSCVNSSSWARGMSSLPKLRALVQFGWMMWHVLGPRLNCPLVYSAAGECTIASIMKMFQSAAAMCVQVGSTPVAAAAHPRGRVFRAGRVLMEIFEQGAMKDQMVSVQAAWSPLP